jgi:hypothetical protein
MSDPREPTGPAEQSADQLQALEILEDALHQLTANLLRVVRGAGNPHQIGPDATACTDAMITYRNAYGLWPASDVLAEIVHFKGELAQYRTDRSQRDVASQEADTRRMAAKHEICRGVLQIIASDLLGQIPQRAAGESEFRQGINKFRDADDAYRRTHRP